MDTGLTIDGLQSGYAVEQPAEQRDSPTVRVIRQPLTYDARLVQDRNSRAPHGLRAISTREQRSYVQDFCLAQMNGNTAAAERLAQHAREMKEIGEKRDLLLHPTAEYRFEPGVEERATNWSAGTGGYFAPPLWLVEQFAVQPTPARVLSKLAPQFELPEGVQSVNIPTESAGGEVGNAPLGAPAITTSMLDSGASSAVATIAGNYDVPMQMLEQSPQGAHLDWIAFTTMEARYGYQLELQMINGTGAAVPQGSGNNQLLGIYNNTQIPAANVVTFTNGGLTAQASPGTAASVAFGATTMFSFLGFLVSKVGQSRLLPPEGWLMSTSRSAWLGSSEDQQSRPLMIVDNSEVPGTYDLLAYPVYPNDAIPRTSGTGANEERIICFRHSDWVLLESERRTSVGQLKRDTGGGATGRDINRGAAMADALSGTLMVRLQMRRYVAAVLRYPSSVAYLSGAGMATGGGW